MQDLQNADDADKRVVYATGYVTDFGVKKPDDCKATLYFNGKLDDGTIVSRLIKLSKKFKCFDYDATKPMREQELPKDNALIYANLQLETWVYNGRLCMRVLAMEIERLHSPEEAYVYKMNENPFSKARDEANEREEAKVG